MNLLILLPIILALVFFVPQISYEHQDGCHRWHSCPSDSGSYVCGDLGYDTYCPNKSTIVYVPVPDHDYSMVVQTDKKSYTEGEVIIITITTQTINSAVSIVIKDSQGNIVQLDKGALEPRKILNTQFIAGGKLMNEHEIYSIDVVAVNNITGTTSFEYIPPILSLKEQLKRQIPLDEIICRGDFELIVKNNGNVICISHSTAIKLLERNWGSLLIPLS